MTVAATDDISQYDAASWADLARWKHRRFERESWHLLPRGVRRGMSRAAGATKDQFEKLPGAQNFEALFVDALRGLSDAAARTARASVRRGALVEAYRKRGHDVTDLDDIRKLELRDIDQVKPRLDIGYILASTLEGAGAGFAVSGGTILATGGTVFGAGAGAAPGAATVVGVMAADAAAVLVASQRAIAHIAAYYGYDVDEPHERLFALGVLGVGTADEVGKAAAYAELNKLVQALARRQTWQQLNSRAVARIVSQVYSALGMRLTQRSLGKAVPVVGIALGAGLNAKTLSKVVDDAEHLYRERFLREKYGLPQATPDETVTGGGDAVALTEIVDAEIVDEDEDAS